jgi:hypothetical protein
MSKPKAPESHPDLFGVEVDSVAVKWLENLLRGHGGWMTARDIILTTRGKAHERTLRELASKSSQVISGQKGYKHISHASAEEIDRAANWLVSQGKQMIKRGLTIRRSGHRRIG